MSSYTAVPNEQPPSYEGGSNPSSPYDALAPRQAGDNIPDDFKYSVDVASCELPIRQMFVRKVYSLLTLQIMSTVVVGFLVRASPSFTLWCLDHFWFMIVTMLVTFGLAIATQIKARSYPINLVLLGLFTAGEALTLGIVCALIESEIVVKALLITTVIFVGLTLFAFQTKYDFTSWQGVLGMSLWALIGFGFISMFFPGQSSTVELIYSGIGAVVFSIYIVVDTQIIMKTAHLDDEIVSTMKLYLDILNLFLFILRLLQNRQE